MSSMSRNIKRAGGLIDPAGRALAGTPRDMAELVSRAILDLECIEASTMVMLEFNVLMKIADKERVTRGGIVLSGAEVDKQLFASCVAEVVSFGEECWLNGDGSEINNRPAAGDKVLLSKYAGIPFRDAEYNLYRLAHDKDVVSIISRASKKPATKEKK